MTGKVGVISIGRVAYFWTILRKYFLIWQLTRVLFQFIGFIILRRYLKRGHRRLPYDSKIHSTFVFIVLMTLLGSRAFYQSSRLWLVSHIYGFLVLVWVFFYHNFCIRLEIVNLID
jgi:hypothetical protein